MLSDGDDSMYGGRTSSSSADVVQSPKTRLMVRDTWNFLFLTTV